MRHVPIEPGLMRLFRWYVAIRLVLLLFLQLSSRDPNPGDPLFVPAGGIVILGSLLAYLYAPPLQRKLGRWYLPIAIWVATLGPAIENALNVTARLDAGATANEAIADYWLYFFYLFVPLILVAWQYRYRWVVLFSLGTFVVDGVLVASQLEDTGADVALLGALMLGRAGLFLLVGLVINRLVAAQRKEREALAENAITRERLAMSEERRRLARELHDTLAHTLSGVALHLEGATVVWDEDPNKAREMVNQSLDATRTGLVEARRAITALRAAPLDEEGLVAALQEMSEVATDTSGTRVSFLADGPGPDDPDVEHTAFRIASEALSNAIRHADPDNVEIHLSGNPAAWRLTVEDDGTGFDVNAVPDGDHLGLAGMSERAELIDAALLIESGAAGTRVELAKGREE